MTKGPKINYSNRNFTTRDNLGINAAGTSFQAELCPVINTVTPRAFYWAFATWNYYDYWQNYKTDKRSLNDFEVNFLKRNDYFFVLANLLIPGSDRNNLVGKDNCALDIRNNGPYMYNRKYFKSHYGGMQYYVPGCVALGLITETDNEGNSFSIPKLTEKVGLPIALAFESVVKDTEYYRSYRLADIPVPKSVLEELGTKLDLSMSNMAESKRLLRDVFFTPTRNILLDNENLILSKDYLLFLDREFGIKGANSAEMREILYDYFTPGGSCEHELPENLRGIATAWEVAIGRQYFTLAIELIWKYMLLELTTPMDISTWIERCLQHSSWSIKLTEPLNSIVEKAYFDFETRETMLANGYRGSKNVAKNLETGLLVLLSVCNRFMHRKDVGEFQMRIGGSSSVLSMSEKVQEYAARPVADFLAYVMSEWILRRHEAVSFRKMMEGRDGYFVEKIDGKYYHKSDAYPDYTGNRLMQLKSVMIDLDMMG